MPYAVLGGVTLNVDASTGARENTYQGNQHAAMNGGTVDGRRERRRAWSVTAICSEKIHARSIECWALGMGHVCSFTEGLHASTGLLPSPGHSAYLDVAEGALVVPAGAAIAWPAQLGAEWTVCFRRLDGVTWTHYAVTSEGSQFKDGVRGTWFGAAATAPLQVLGGAPTLRGRDAAGAGADASYDDLAILLFRASDAFIAALSAATDPPPPLPYQTLAGDILDGESTMLVRCEARSEMRTRGGFGARGSPYVADMGWQNDTPDIEIDIAQVTVVPWSAP